MKGKKTAIVFHSEIWGLREDKYQWLNKHDLTTTKWKRLNPKSEFYLFIPRGEGLLKQYETYSKITDIFPVNSVGIVTARDNFVIDFNRDALLRRIRQFRDKKMPDEIIGQTYDLKDKANWKLKDAREAVMQDDDWEKAVTKILYRPFDEQWIFYHDALIERSRKEVMQHMMHENLALATCRQISLNTWQHCLVTDKITESCFVSNKTSEINYLFPLYLYQQKDKPKKRSSSAIMMLFEPREGYQVRKPNLSPVLIEALTKSFKKHPSPEQIFYYIYAILYSNTYRTKYAEFLKIDFPRIPFATDYKIFNKMAEYGEKLVELHLLKASDDAPIARFQGSGNDKVEKLRYEKGRLFINNEQYFEGISQEVWEYKIGGYQFLDKWLKDRKGKVLSLGDIKHYCAVVAAIQKTIEIQKEIDDIYLKVEKEII